jgi:hypothetical protein
MQTNFLLGTIQLTEEARKALRRQPYDLLVRHAINEHGQVSIAELKENLHGMKTLGPIVSRYRVDPTTSASPWRANCDQLTSAWLLSLPTSTRVFGSSSKSLRMIN